MKNKVWFEIRLNAGVSDEVIAKVKSKGLAYLVLKQLQTVYENSPELTVYINNKDFRL